MQRCIKCILPETYPSIHFGHDGVCNICQKTAPKPIVSEKIGADALKDAVEPYRNRGKYDCLVGFSGGRDSTFVLYYLVKVLNLRPLAVTIDNGFMPSEIKESNERTVSILAVDHIIIPQRLTWNTFWPLLSSWQKKPDPALIAFLCNGCQEAIKKNLKKVAKEHDIHLIIGGGGDLVGKGGEPEESFAEPLLRRGSEIFGSKLSLIIGAFIHLSRNTSYLVKPNLLISFAREAYYRHLYKFSDENLKVLGLFEYISWDENNINKTIVEKLGWKKPDNWPSMWRADCIVHWVKEYCYLQTLGFTKNEELLSGMIRTGAISREDAYKRIQNDNNLPDEFIRTFLLEHSIDLSHLTRFN
jgi:hypothetical protein